MARKVHSELGNNPGEIFDSNFYLAPFYKIKPINVTVEKAEGASRKGGKAASTKKKAVTKKKKCHGN